MTNNKIIFLLFLLIPIYFYSCNKEKFKGEEIKNFAESKLNDSLDIIICFDNKNSTIGSIIIKNRKNCINYFYGFHSDGITPCLIGKEKNGMREGLYFTYYSTGALNNKINYKEGEFDGEYVSFSEQGNIIYKAYYKKGIEKRVEIKDSSEIIKIVEFNE